MICSTPPNSNQNHLILSLKSNSHCNDNSTGYTDMRTSHDLLEDVEEVKYHSLKTHWETIERYYVDRLESLKKEIDNAIYENSKLSLAREDLVKEIIRLNRNLLELSQKASPYQGVSLEDKPYNPPTPPLPPTMTESPVSANDLASQHKGSLDEADKTPKQGLFRQISFRLSNKKKKSHDEEQPPLVEDSASPNPIVPGSSSSEPLIHPAAVVSEKRSENKLASLRRNNSFHSTVKKSMFGNDLIKQAKSEKSIIPSIVLKCVREIESRGLSVEGIYRKAGTTAQLKELEDAFNENKEPKLYKYQDIHVIASVLKSYLRNLPEPLLSNDFVLYPGISDQERLNKTYTLLHSLPIESYCTVKFIVQHLKRVHQNQSVNRMPSKNLAVVLGPTLMKFNSGNEEQQMREMIKTIDFIILQSHILFADYF